MSEETKTRFRVIDGGGPGVRLRKAKGKRK
jgi:hypothetical protein